MWVQLLVVQQIDRNGVMKTYRPGDWVDVGRQTALLWVTQRKAVMPMVREGLSKFNGQAGLIVTNDGVVYEPLLKQSQIELQVVELHQPALMFKLNIIWDGKVMLRPELIPVGLSFLEAWEVACPLYSYDELACHLGTIEDQQRTKAIIRDLRAPVYDTRLMFVRDCEMTQRLFKVWELERRDSHDDRLAFMRAFYSVKPLMLALPITWTSPRAYANE